MRLFSFYFLITILLIIGQTASASDLWMNNPPGKDDAHIGANPGIPDGREGGETVNDAFVIPALPFSETGNTSDNIDEGEPPLEEDGFVTASGIAEYDTYIFLLLPTDCNSVGVVMDATCLCEQAGVIEFTPPAGDDFWIWFGPTEFAGPVFEYDYIITIDGIVMDLPSASEHVSWGEMKAKFQWGHQSY